MKTKTTIITNDKTRLPFRKDELDLLKKFIELQPRSAYTVIRKSTNISRSHVLSFIERGWMEKKPALRMRDFINELKKTPELLLEAI